LLANKAPNIHYATSCCYILKKRLGCSKKEEREEEKENKRKRTNVKFSPKSLSFRERYEKNSLERIHKYHKEEN
jgi:hypothetical protein